MPSRKEIWIPVSRRTWLVKSEPSVYSIDDLERDGTTTWEGVRNYQARNILRDDMAEGDLVLFYHSREKPLGVAGVARVARAGYPDSFAFDPVHPYHDPKSDPDDPTWYMVDLEFVERFPEVVDREAMKERPELSEMLVLKRGQRLSVMPVAEEELETVVGMGRVPSRPTSVT